MQRTRLVPSSLLIACLATCAAHAAEPGFSQDFTSDTGGFFSFALPTHAPSGGVGGAGDGYLLLSQPIETRLGARNDTPQFTGDLIADGVGGFSFWLKDVGAPDDLEIHIGFGESFVSVWQSVQGFHPTGEWQEFSVDLTDPSAWVQILGIDSFEQTQQNCDRVFFRFDRAPFESQPDEGMGDFGIDRVTVLAIATGGGAVPEASPSSTWIAVALLLTAGILALRSRRFANTP